MTNVIGYNIQCEIDGDPFWWDGSHWTPRREYACRFTYKNGAERLAPTLHRFTARVVPVEEKTQKKDSVHLEKL